VENVNVELGSFVSYGTVLAQLIDNSSLKIDIYLSEQEALKIKKGQMVSISSVTIANTKTGKINMISDKADESGKFLSEIRFNNTGDELLKAGILADVHFSTDATVTGLSVPVSALLGSARDAKVFVVNGNHVEQKNIKTGIVTAEKVQVTEGLAAGKEVVVSGQLNLENGSPITINK
jgi:membrane fusion protein, multidrug efflux system